MSRADASALDPQSFTDQVLRALKSPGSDELFPVDVLSILPGSQRDFDLFYRKADGKTVLFCGRDYDFTERTQLRIFNMGLEELYIPAEQAEAFFRYQEEHLSEIIADESIQPTRRARVLQSTGYFLMRDVMAEPRAKALIGRAGRFVSSTVQFVLKEPTAVSHLMSLTSKDYYTYTHSVNVSILGVALLRRVRRCQHNACRVFGMGALLHDIGKCRIDPEILTKPGKLTDQEFAVIKTHPVIGYELLAAGGELPEEALSIVRWHHERFGGGGYPDGLSGSAIPEAAAITCACDVYDALTTNRSYRKAMTGVEAMELMTGPMADHFSPEILRTFLAMIRSNHPKLQKPAEPELVAADA